MAPTDPWVLLSSVLLFAGAFLQLTTATSPPSGNLSAYEALQTYDFPAGLLPRGVVGYDLDAGTGRFSAYLNGTCSFAVEGSYQLRYRPTISGNISRGRLRELSGVSVKVLLFWVNIIEVTRRGNQLEFSVGIASADFSVDNFLQCPQCGCGFDCPSALLPSGKEAPRVKWSLTSS